MYLNIQSGNSYNFNKYSLEDVKQISKVIIQKTGKN